MDKPWQWYDILGYEHDFASSVMLLTEQHLIDQYFDLLLMLLAMLLSVIAVCTYRVAMISIERSETAQKSALEI